MSVITQAMLTKLLKEGNTITIISKDRNLRKKSSQRMSLLKSFKDDLSSRRKVLPINTRVVPIPKPG